MGRAVDWRENIRQVGIQQPGQQQDQRVQINYELVALTRPIIRP